jgi:hypothetical protein
MKKITKLAGFWLSSVALFYLTGCATIVDGTKQPISVEARTDNGFSVAGATCKLENPRGTWYVTTPGSVVIHRASEELSISCMKGGQQIGAAGAGSSTQMMVLGNALFGGLIGVGVDYIDGAAYKYPRLVTVRANNAAGAFDGSGGNQLPTAQRQVLSGTPTMIAAHANWSDLCNPDASAPSISVLDWSQHGSIEIRQGGFTAPSGNPTNSCSNGKIYGTQVFYSPQRGFHGADRIRYEVVSSTGRFTRVVEIAVE